MNNKERILISSILVIVIVLVVTDLVSDSGEGAVWWHLFSEGCIAALAAGGLFLLLKGSFKLKHELEHERKNFTEFKIQAEKWKSESKKFIDGLSGAIDSQLTQWNLTASEKEIAFLLLKGFSSKEIAELRNTSEKTVRAQSVSIYAKSGLGGRSELSAFFLEELLPPSKN